MYGQTGEVDIAGNAVTFIFGTVLGALLLIPILPRTLPVPVEQTTVSPVVAVLLASALALVLLPLAVVGLHQLYAELDR